VVHKFLSVVASAFEALTVTEMDATLTKFELGRRILIELLKVPTIKARLDEFDTFFFLTSLACTERVAEIKTISVLCDCFVSLQMNPSEAVCLDHI
jgi:small nuclear ribonucleoprotein (snRNP)-like protein